MSVLLSLFLLGGSGSGLLRRLGHFASSLGLLHSLDHADGHGLSHVTDGEAAQRSVVSEGLHTERLGRDQIDDALIYAIN